MPRAADVSAIIASPDAISTTRDTSDAVLGSERVGRSYPWPPLAAMGREDRASSKSLGGTVQKLSMGCRKALRGPENAPSSLAVISRESLNTTCS